MTYRAPITLSLLSNPFGVDREIQELQQELATDNSWLEYSFGRAYLGSGSSTSEKVYLYPTVYKGAKNYQDASPNDLLRSQSFFFVDSPATPIDDATSLEYQKFSQDVSLIVWGSLKKVNEYLQSPFGDEHFGAFLLQKVLNTIRKNDSFKVKRIYDNDRDVFSEFTVRTNHPDLFYYPYFCYRIVMEVAFDQDCETVLNSFISETGGLDYTLDITM